MRKGKWKSILILLMIMVFLAGLATMLYPYIYGAIVDHEITMNAEAFLSWVDIIPATTGPDEPPLIEVTEPAEETKPDETQPREYQQLWEDMVAYNNTIYAQGQSGLSCEYGYQKPSFFLREYGLEDETFGVISIPAMDLEMPICATRS